MPILNNLTDVKNYINIKNYNNSYKDDLHVILQNDKAVDILQPCLPRMNITSFHQYDVLSYTLMAEIVLQLKISQLNVTFAQEVVDLLYDHSNTAISDKLQPFLKKLHNNKTINHCLNESKKYIQDILSLADTKAVIIIGTDHSLLYKFIKLAHPNIEIIFFGSKRQHRSLGDESLPQNRHLILHDPGTWYNYHNKDLLPQGIEIIDCQSIEQSAHIVTELLNENKSMIDDNKIIITSNLQLLQRLEILLDDFSYGKKVVLDPVVYFLQRILENDFVANQQETSMLIRNELFQGLQAGEELYSAHIKYFQALATMEISPVAEQFLEDLKCIIPALQLSSLQDYIEIFSYLAHNIVYNDKPYAPIQAISPQDAHIRYSDNIIITSDSEVEFYQLLHAENIFIIHIKGAEEPQWLRKMRVLLSNKLSYSSIETTSHQESPKRGNPPLYARPKILSATMIEMLMRDPYAFYIRYILKVKPTDISSEAMDFGIFVHNTLAKYNKQADGYDSLLKCGHEEIAKYTHIPSAQTIWWPKFKAMAQRFIVEDTQRRTRADNIECEVKLNFKIADYTITVTCDRIEQLQDGSYAIIEYKTGTVPTYKDIKLGMAPQLLLQAIAVQESMGKEVSELSYWQLKPDGIIIKKITDIQEEILNTSRGLTQLLKDFTTMQFSPTAYYKNYQHASRLREVFL